MSEQRTRNAKQIKTQINTYIYIYIISIYIYIGILWYVQRYRFICRCTTPPSMCML